MCIDICNCEKAQRPCTGGPLQEALAQATQAAAEEQMAQQMAELERYAATTEQLFTSCTAASDASPTAEADAPAAATGGRAQLRMHNLAPGCRMPVPQGAAEVASGAIVTGVDGQPCMRVPHVAVLQPFLKVCPLCNPPSPLYPWPPGKPGTCSTHHPLELDFGAARPVATLLHCIEPSLRTRHLRRHVIARDAADARET